MTKQKKILGIILVLILSLFIRLILIDRIPLGINNDELHFVLKAKSFFYGTPISFDEASSTIFAPIIGVLPLNFFTVKLPYVIFSVLSILLIYLIVNKLTKNQKLALLISLAACLNPWSIYTARTAFDAPIAIFFFLLSLYFIISQKPLLILLSTLSGFLAFNSYIGTKIIYCPFILICSYYSWKFINKKLAKYYLITAIFSIFITASFVFSLSNSSSVGHRVSELWTPNSPQIVSIVNNERRESLRPALPIFTNKYTVYFRKTFEKYLNNFSPNILFLNGDPTFTGSLWIHGYFYYLDILLIIFGIVFLFKNYRYFLFLISSFILLSPIPEAIRSDSIPAYVFHSSLQYPFLFILVGAGGFYVLKLLPKKIFKFAFIFLYLLSFLNFLNVYFIKSPVFQPESFVFSRRVISKYLSLENKNNRQVYFLTQEPEFMYRTFLFYNNFFTRENFKSIQNEYSKSSNLFTFQKIHFTNDYKLIPKGTDYTLIFDTNNFTFDNPGPALHVSRISDAGKIFSIYRGSSCQNIPLENFVHNINFFDLNIEKLETDNFCRKFITW